MEKIGIFRERLTFGGRTRGYFGTMDRFRGWARGKVLFARDGAPGAYLDQFARELQALRLELRMETCDVRI